MPNRVLREGIVDSKAFNALSDSSQIFYYRLISLVDDYGRYEADIEVLRSRLFGRQLDRWPLERVSEALHELSNAKCTRGSSALVTVYCVDDRKYLQINNFNQRVQPKPKCPAPDSPGVTVTDGASPSFASRSRSKAEITFSPAPVAGDGQDEFSGFALVAPEHQIHSDAEKLRWFKDLWDSYWRKVGKGAARKAFFSKVKTEADWERIKAAIVAQMPEMLAREPEHRPHLSTWLNQDRMFDEPPPPRMGPASQDKNQRRRDEGNKVAKLLRERK